MSEKQKLRRRSRILALESLFCYLERKGEVPLEDCFRYILEQVEEETDFDDFAWEIVSVAVQNLGKIKVLIRAFAPEFSFNKIVAINRTILILGIGEMRFLKTPPVVVINEYIELAKEFGEDKSPSFVNGVLDNYRKNLELNATASSES